MLLQNEEELKVKLLLPFITDLGFDLSEIFLEESFSIRLGKARHTIHGRADILCKRNGKNLFIIELKRDSVTISEDDIEQGISYARLLTDNIAPFTVITNGKTTRVFDTITREELTGTKISMQSSYWQNGFTLSTDIDLRIRYEALKKFISFSPENLKWFCEQQVGDRMGPIIGDIHNPHAKFVKELYVNRQCLQDTFASFIDSTASVFGIVGPAGVGKTSTMCALALKALETDFVFFYNAAIINKSPSELIVCDLNGVFSSKSESDSALKKLDEIGRFLDRNIVIFIDGIDESTDSGLVLDLSEMALTVRNLDRVKICISCKSNIWSNVLKKNGTPTHLYEELAKSHHRISGLDNCPGFLLEDFNESEIQDVIPLYEGVFGFKGTVSKVLFDALKNGFFLRIFSEVYSQKEIPNDINDKELIKNYLDQSLQKTNIGAQRGLRILAKIGNILLNHKYNSRQTFLDEGVEIENLLEQLAFSVEEDIPEDLFSRNILIKSSKEESYNITFYYSRIRDYIICYHSYKLDKLSDQQFYDLLETFYENNIGQSALSFYLKNAGDSHKRTLIKFKKDKSLQYADSYNDYLENHFKKFKNKFDPKTDGEIGILIPDSLKTDGYALFPLESGSVNKVQYGILDNPFSDTFDNNLLYKKRVQSVHTNDKSLFIANQDETVHRNVFKQLKEIIDQGKLNAYNSDILMLEQVSNILYYYSRQLGYNYGIKDYYLPRFDCIYPINLKKLRDQVHKFLVKEYYNQPHLTLELRADRIKEALKNNSKVPALNITGDFPPIEELSRIVEILLHKGYDTILEHHLPCPDISLLDTKQLYESDLRMNQIRVRQFSEEQSKLYMETFFRCFEICYKEFVEYLFPTLKYKLPFFKTSPHEYFVYIKESDPLQWGYWGYRSAKGGGLKVNYKKISSLDDAYKFGEIQIFRAFSLDKILHNDHIDSIKTIDKLNTPKLDEFCVLRNWVYKILKEDMNLLFKENI